MTQDEAAAGREDDSPELLGGGGGGGGGDEADLLGGLAPGGVVSVELDTRMANF